MCTEPLFGGLEEWGLRELPLDPAPLSVPNLDRCSTRQFAQLSGDAAARGTREPVRAGARVAPVSPYQGFVLESMPAADPAGDSVSDCRRFRSRLLSSCESSSSRCIRKISRSTCSCRAICRCSISTSARKAHAIAAPAAGARCSARMPHATSCPNPSLAPNLRPRFPFWPSGTTFQGLAGVFLRNSPKVLCSHIPVGIEHFPLA